MSSSSLLRKSHIATGNKATTTAEVTAEVIEAKRKQVIKLFGNSKRLGIHRYGYARHHGWW
jgi:ribosomal protein L21